MKRKFYCNDATGVNADLERHAATEKDLKEKLAKYEAEGNEQAARTYRVFLGHLLASKAEVASKIGKKKGL